jgi:hypothetical protein
VVNKDITTTNLTKVTINTQNSGSYDSTAQLISLTGSSPYLFSFFFFFFFDWPRYTQYSITLAGQTFDNTTNGLPTGTRKTTPIVGENGMYPVIVGETREGRDLSSYTLNK